MNTIETKTDNLHQAIKEILIDELVDLNQSEAGKWIEDLENYGCVSGMVGSLIYYSDTTRFFDDFENEILEIAKEYEFHPDAVDLGITGFKNQMAWFALEILARSVFEGLEFPEE